MEKYGLKTTPPDMEQMAAVLHSVLVCHYTRSFYRRWLDRKDADLQRR
jgi:hypothetical protein